MVIITLSGFIFRKIVHDPMTSSRSYQPKLMKKFTQDCSNGNAKRWGGGGGRINNCTGHPTIL